MWRFLVAGVGRVALFVNALQGFCWIIGLFDECTACAKRNSGLAIVAVPAYFLFTGILWDARRFKLHGAYKRRLEAPPKRKK